MNRIYKESSLVRNASSPYVSQLELQLRQVTGTLQLATCCRARDSELSGVIVTVTVDAAAASDRDLAPPEAQRTGRGLSSCRVRWRR